MNFNLMTIINFSNIIICFSLLRKLKDLMMKGLNKNQKGVRTKLLLNKLISPIVVTSKSGFEMIC